jgi:hypothetical protein
MFTRHKMIPLAVCLALGVPAAAGAQDLGFSYLEGGFIGAFVNDIEQSGVITGIDSTFELESDAGGGGFINGAWQFGESVHLFGEYSSAAQDLEVRGGDVNVEGDYDVLRWRIGVGYAYPFSPTTSLYGRLSFDNTEFKNLKVAGFDLDADVDEDGLGGEFGMIWAATPSIQVQGHVRYTSVGEIAPDGSDSLDSDILVGLNGRWYFRPDIALVTGYEYGKITTFNLGARFSF